MSGIKSDDLIAFLIEEAQHQVINDQRGKNAEIALAAYSKNKKKKIRKGQMRNAETVKGKVMVLRIAMQKVVAKKARPLGRTKGSKRKQQLWQQLEMKMTRCLHLPARQTIQT